MVGNEYVANIHQPFLVLQPFTPLGYMTCSIGYLSSQIGFNAFSKGRAVGKKIQLEHPEGKNAIRMDENKYQVIHKEIVKVIKEKKSIQPMMLLEEVSKRLSGKIEGSIKWYGCSVKLDMEAKKQIEHDRKKGLIRLVT